MVDLATGLGRRQRGDRFLQLCVIEAMARGAVRSSEHLGQHRGR